MMPTAAEGPVPYELVEPLLLVLIRLDGPRLMTDLDDVLQHLAAARAAWQRLPGPVADDQLPSHQSP